MEGASYRSIARALNRPLSSVYEALKDVQVESDIEDGVLEIVDAKFNELVEILSVFIRDVIETICHIGCKDPDKLDPRKVEAVINEYVKRLDKLRGVGRR